LLHDPFQSVETVQVERQAVVLDGAPILQLVLGHDAVGAVIDPFRSVDRLAVT
jgi:hypothetical protein